MYILQLHWHPPNPANPARNLAGARLGWIFEKWPDSGFAGAEIWYDPTDKSIKLLEINETTNYSTKRNTDCQRTHWNDAGKTNVTRLTSQQCIKIVGADVHKLSKWLPTVKPCAPVHVEWVGRMEAGRIWSRIKQSKTNQKTAVLSTRLSNDEQQYAKAFWRNLYEKLSQTYSRRKKAADCYSKKPLLTSIVDKASETRSSLQSTSSLTK